MIHKMPELQESIEYFRQWDLYKKKLLVSEKVELYIGELLKIWITKIPNPLEIPIVLNLIENKPREFENNLNNFESHIGEKNLKAYMGELKGIMQPNQIWQKIKSLDYEVHVYNELIKNSKYVNKVDSVGDWETEDKIISVKSILDLDLNYQMIENLLRSFFYIKEYEIIRRYNSIWVKNKKKDVNYKFRNIVLNYLRNNIIGVLKAHDIVYLQYPEICETKNYDLTDLKISIDTVIDNNKQKIISVHLASKNEIASELTVEFKVGVNNSCFSIMYDSNTFWVTASNFNEKYILNRIKELIAEIDSKFVSHVFTKSFEGWITLPIHAKDEEYFINNKKSFKDKLSKVKTNKAYKIYLFIIPQHGFDLKNKLLFEI